MILVTGATGLLGMHVVYELVSTGQPVRALYRNPDKIAYVKKLVDFYSPESSDELFAKIEWAKADVLDIIELTEAMDGVTEVYHCAAIVSFRNRGFTNLITTNRQGTSNLVNLAIEKKVKKFCHVSSTAAVGKSTKDPDKIVVESNKWEQNESTTGYAISKYLSEKEVWRGIEEGLNAVIVNPCVILGPGNWDESSLTIFRAINNGMRFYPPGANAIVDARDVAFRMIQLMELPVHAERYLIVGQNITFKQLFDAIALRLGKRPPSIRVRKWLMGISWRVAGVFSFFMRRPTALTRQSTQSAFSTTRYSTEKIDSIIPENYYNIIETVDNAVRFYEFNIPNKS